MYQATLGMAVSVDAALQVCATPSIVFNIAFDMVGLILLHPSWQLITYDTLPILMFTSCTSLRLDPRQISLSQWRLRTLSIDIVYCRTDRNSCLLCSHRPREFRAKNLLSTYWVSCLAWIASMVYNTSSMEAHDGSLTDGWEPMYPIKKWAPNTEWSLWVSSRRCKRRDKSLGASMETKY